MTRLILLAMAAVATIMLVKAEDDDVIKFSLEKKRSALISTPERMRHSLAKFGLEAPDYLSHQQRHQQLLADAASVNLTSAMTDIEYIGKISLGHPPQEFNVNFDTGSYGISVAAVGCYRCGGRNRFDFATSDSFSSSSVNSSWQVRYADGSGMSGTIGSDTMTVGDITIEKQIFGLISEQIGFSRDPFLDGLFGLAFPALSAFNNNSNAIVQDLYKVGKVKEPLVGIWLSRTGVGEVMFGSSNTNHYEGELEYIPIEKKAFWSVTLKRLRVNNINVLTTTNTTAIIDSGTTLIVVPSETCKQIHAAISGSSFDPMYGWRMPCDSVNNQTKIISFQLGHYDFPMTVADVVREGSEAGSGLCYSGIVESKSTAMVILGNTFLKKYYSVFDYGNMRVGLALSK